VNYEGMDWKEVAENIGKNGGGFVLKGLKKKKVVFTYY